MQWAVGCAWRGKRNTGTLLLAAPQPPASGPPVLGGSNPSAPQVEVFTRPTVRRISTTATIATAKHLRAATRPAAAAAAAAPYDLAGTDSLVAAPPPPAGASPDAIACCVWEQQDKRGGGGGGGDAGCLLHVPVQEPASDVLRLRVYDMERFKVQVRHCCKNSTILCAVLAVICNEFLYPSSFKFLSWCTNAQLLHLCQHAASRLSPSFNARFSSVLCSPECVALHSGFNASSARPPPHRTCCSPTSSVGCSTPSPPAPWWPPPPCRWRPCVPWAHTCLPPHPPRPPPVPKPPSWWAP